MRQFLKVLSGSIVFLFIVTFIVTVEPVRAQAGCTMRHITLGPPDQGLIVQAVPSGVSWEIFSLGTLYYASSAGSGNRTVILRARLPIGDVYAFSPNPLKPSPGTTVGLSWSAGMGPAIASDVGVGGWPIGLQLSAGHILETVVENRHFLDSFGTSILVVRECPQ